MREGVPTIELARQLGDNYFTTPGCEVRVFEDEAGVPVLVALVRGSKRRNVVGLRLLDFPLAPPTLRLWSEGRWTEANFVFDFTGNGDLGAGTTQAQSGAYTFCVRYHVDYYKGGWHQDSPWDPRAAHEQLADLVVNILGGGHYN
jgi:hypothetical protein